MSKSTARLSLSETVSTVSLSRHSRSFTPHASPILKKRPIMASSRDSSPASSQLSSHGSSEFGDVKVEDADSSTLEAPPSDSHLMPPNKRRRTDASSHQSTPLPTMDTNSDAGYVSSDTDGSIPSSPNTDHFSMMMDEDPRAHVQVRSCKWDGCNAGDLGNMDNLVTHLHDEHIGTKETNYACEWMDCSRKGTPHASGYALKAHMRSHTKEKPFYCALPGMFPHLISQPQL